jgi:hypothetical protein
MKLIVSELEVLRTYVSREFYHVMRALITDFNWRHVETRELWNASENLRDTLLRHYDELPEVILFWEGYDSRGRPALVGRGDEVEEDSRIRFMRDGYFHGRLCVEQAVSGVCGHEESRLGATFRIAGFYGAVQSESGECDLCERGIR